jgi:hypothetical protein
MAKAKQADETGGKKIFIEHQFCADEMRWKIPRVSRGRKRRGAALPAAVQDAQLSTFNFHRVN